MKYKILLLLVLSIFILGCKGIDDNVVAANPGDFLISYQEISVERVGTVKSFDQDTDRGNVPMNAGVLVDADTDNYFEIFKDKCLSETVLVEEWADANIKTIKGVPHYRTTYKCLKGCANQQIIVEVGDVQYPMENVGYCKI